MRTLALWAAVLVLAGMASPARADSIYRYRDPSTKRDVFVNWLDQVPAQLRAEATPVVSDGVLVDSTSQADKDAPRGAVIYGSKKPAGALETIEQAVRDATASGHAAGELERALTTAIDTALVARGKPPLSAREGAQFKRVLVESVVVLAVACLLSIVAWILVIVHAFRADHRWWMVFILLFPALGIAYVLVHVEGKRHWFKFTTLFAQAAPYAVALAMSWRFFAFFRTILAGS
jgi:hypothetical protein